MTDRGNVPIVLLPGEGRSIEWVGAELSVKASADDTDDLFSLIETDESAGSGPGLHIHHDAAETFYVLDGEYTMFIDGREYLCPAGSFVYIPAGKVHGFRVGAQASRKLNLYTPAAMVGFFDEVSAAMAAGGPSPEERRVIATKYGLESIGPLPPSSRS
jgi:mannose-6-phosphate isomerase-like protein (cupin superfamily)